MKKLFLVAAAAIAIAACGGGDAVNKDKAADSKEQTGDDLSKNPDYAAGLELVAQSDCSTCHKVEEASTGPAFRAIAAKYPNTQETVDMLSEKIIKGGSGNWGAVMMTPHPNLSKEDAGKMVKYVMLLKK